MSYVLNFVKNHFGSVKYATILGIAAAGTVVGSSGCSELSDLLFDSDRITAVSSSVGQFVSAVTSFTIAQVGLNYRPYVNEKNRLDFGLIGKDIFKAMIATSALDATYLVAKPFMVNFLLNYFRPGIASIGTDLTLGPLYFCVAIPIGHKIGLIKEKKGSTLI